ncbi:hypothetical protein PHJA_001901900 [Phtheirospermum japonicum]|uniref:Uncharacterized protein n=1 Tax=Phtheirospermum japonicum TaxID=374723 RepID=A0A830CJX5_9LAMI|nr:hypothetical protein PHJA_001901900 [Phtheirospermum japonicum]
MNEGDYSGAIIRHHLRSDHELGNANINIAAQLTAIQNQLTHLNDRFDAIEATNMADRARAFNSRIDSSSSASRRFQFRPVVKHTRGHLVALGLPPAVANVNLQPEYVLGAQPPNGLIPLTHAGFDRIGTEEIHVLRRRLRAIYWFYNDDRLRLTANASRNACDNAIQNVKDYYLSP